MDEHASLSLLNYEALVYCQLLLLSYGFIDNYSPSSGRLTAVFVVLGGLLLAVFMPHSLQMENSSYCLSSLETVYSQFLCKYL